MKNIIYPETIFINFDKGKRKQVIIVSSVNIYFNEEKIWSKKQSGNRYQIGIYHGESSFHFHKPLPEIHCDVFKNYFSNRKIEMQFQEHAKKYQRIYR